MGRFRGDIMLAQAILLPKIGIIATKNRYHFATKNRYHLPKIGITHSNEGTLLPLDQGTTNFIGPFPSK